MGFRFMLSIVAIKNIRKRTSLSVGLSVGHTCPTNTQATFFCLCFVIEIFNFGNKIPSIKAE